MNNSNDPKPLVKQDLMKQLVSDHCIGAPDAVIILLEYGDYEDQTSANAQPLVRHLIETFGDQMKLIYRHYPLIEIHPHAELAAEAAEAAAAQGRFWEMHDLLFRNSVHLNLKALQSYAERLELDMSRFKAEMDDRIYLQRVKEHRHSGELLDLRESPTFFLNGKTIDISFGLERLEDAVFELVKKLYTSHCKLPEGSSDPSAGNALAPCHRQLSLHTFDMAF